MVGLQKQQDKIFMVDFGSCRKYQDIEGNHVKYESTDDKIAANLRFKSIASHIGRSICGLRQRRDGRMTWRAWATCWSIS